MICYHGLYANMSMLTMQWEIEKLVTWVYSYFGSTCSFFRNTSNPLSSHRHLAVLNNRILWGYILRLNQHYRSNWLNKFELKLLQQQNGRHYLVPKIPKPPSKYWTRSSKNLGLTVRNYSIFFPNSCEIYMDWIWVSLKRNWISSCQRIEMNTSQGRKYIGGQWHQSPLLRTDTC